MLQKLKFLLSIQLSEFFDVLIKHIDHLAIIETRFT
jgi:hypothetical protein